MTQGCLKDDSFEVQPLRTVRNSHWDPGGWVMNIRKSDYSMIWSSFDTFFWFSLALPFRTGTQTMLHWRIETQRHILLSGIRFSQRSNNSDLNKNFKLLTDSLSLCFLNIHSVGYTRQNDEFFFYVFFLPLERECEWWWMVVSSTNAFKRQFRWSKWPPNESSDKQEPEDAQVDA